MSVQYNETICQRVSRFSREVRNVVVKERGTTNSDIGSTTIIFEPDGSVQSITNNIYLNGTAEEAAQLKAARSPLYDPERPIRATPIPPPNAFQPIDPRVQPIVQPINQKDAPKYQITSGTIPMIKQTIPVLSYTIPREVLSANLNGYPLYQINKLIIYNDGTIKGTPKLPVLTLSLGNTPIANSLNAVQCDEGQCICTFSNPTSIIEIKNTTG